MGIKVITPPTFEPVSLVEMKTWAHIDSTGDATADAADEVLLSSLITAAREEAENITRRAICEQALELTLEVFPFSGGRVELLRPPFSAIGSITYYDAANVSTVMDSGDYLVVDASDAIPPSVVPITGVYWPDTYPRPDAVAIRYTAGWADAASVPENIKTWIKLRVATLWANRESIVAGNVSASAVEMPSRFADGLLDRWRVVGVA